VSRQHDVSGIKRRAARGFFWSLSSRLACESLQFASGVALARILVPEEFGLYGMVAAFTGMAAVFRSFGIGTALIRHPEVDDLVFSSALWFNVTCGVVLSLVLFLMAPWVADFYSEPLARPLCQLGALNFAISSFGMCHRAILARRMDYLTSGLIEATGQIVFAGAAILLALRSWGVFSLVWGLIVQNSVIVLLLICFTRQPMRFRFSWSRLRPLVHFGGWVMGAQLAKYAQENGSYLLVGRFLGKGPLGIFKKAIASSTMPVRHLVWSVTDVLFPSMAKIEPGSPEMQEFQVRVMRVVGLLTFPACVGLAVVAEPFVVGIYGEKWRQTVVYLQVFSGVALLFCVQHQMQSALMAVGHASKLAKSMWGGTIMQWTGLVVGYRLAGTGGLLAGIFLARMAESSWVAVLCLRGTGLRVRVFAGALAPPLALSLLMGAGVLALRRWCLAGTPLLLELLLASLSGACVYALSVIVVRPMALRDMGSVVRNKLGEERLARHPRLAALLHYLGRA